MQYRHFANLHALYVFLRLTSIWMHVACF